MCPVVNKEASRGVSVCSSSLPIVPLKEKKDSDRGRPLHHKDCVLKDISNVKRGGSAKKNKPSKEKGSKKGSKKNHRRTRIHQKNSEMELNMEFFAKIRRRLQSATPCRICFRGAFEENVPKLVAEVDDPEDDIANERFKDFRRPQEVTLLDMI